MRRTLATIGSTTAQWPPVPKPDDDPPTPPPDDNN